MAWKIKGILAALIAINPVQRLGIYLAEEVLIVLMAIAAMLFVVLLVAIGVILFSSGARFGFLWLSARVWRIAGWGHEQVAGKESIAVLPPRRGEPVPVQPVHRLGRRRRLRGVHDRAGGVRLPAPSVSRRLRRGQVLLGRLCDAGDNLAVKARGRRLSRPRPRRALT